MHHRVDETDINGDIQRDLVPYRVEYYCAFQILDCALTCRFPEAYTG